MINAKSLRHRPLEGILAGRRVWMSIQRAGQEWGNSYIVPEWGDQRIDLIILGALPRACFTIACFCGRFL